MKICLQPGAHMLVQNCCDQMTRIARDRPSDYKVDGKGPRRVPGLMQFGSGHPANRITGVNLCCFYLYFGAWVASTKSSFCVVLCLFQFSPRNSLFGQAKAKRRPALFTHVSHFFQFFLSSSVLCSSLPFCLLFVNFWFALPGLAFPAQTR